MENQTQQPLTIRELAIFIMAMANELKDNEGSEESKAKNIKGIFQKAEEIVRKLETN